MALPQQQRPIRFAVTAGSLTEVSQITELAKKAEDLGVSTVAIADHLGTQLAPLLGLAAAAAATSTLRLQTLVLSNDYRHPAILAKELTTLDQLSGGRLEVGLGAGWMTTDYDQAGIALDRPGIRIARLAESVTILKALLQGETVDFDGEFYQITGLTNGPAAVQQPSPPLLIAGGAPKILGLAGAHGDIVGLNPSLAAGVIDARAGASATPAATDQKLKWVRAAAGDRFGGIELCTRVHLAAITDDRETMAQSLGPALGVSPEDAIESPHALAGSVAQCIESVLKWRERWGITYVAINASELDAMAPVLAGVA